MDAAKRKPMVSVLASRLCLTTSVVVTIKMMVCRTLSSSRSDSVRIHRMFINDEALLYNSTKWRVRNLEKASLATTKQHTTLRILASTTF